MVDGIMNDPSLRYLPFSPYLNEHGFSFRNKSGVMYFVRSNQIQDKIPFIAFMVLVLGFFPFLEAISGGLLLFQK
jgi:hypothetical protein